MFQRRTQATRLKDTLRHQSRKQFQASRAALDVSINRLQNRQLMSPWTQLQLNRTAKHLWATHDILIRFQAWCSYRDGIAQLNLYHDGRQTTTACPLEADCLEAKETFSHISWECQRARAAWTWTMEHWMGTPTTEWGWDVVKLHVIKRIPSTAGDRIWQHVVVNHGFFTEDHSAALKNIWLGLSGIFVSQLWLLGNETVHKQQRLTMDQV